MTGKILSRAIFTELGKKIGKFEESMNEKLLYKNPARADGIWTLEDVPLKKLYETVGIDDELVDAKVLNTVIRGGEEELNILGNFCKVVQMTSPIMTVPLITPDDFKIHPASEPATNQTSGGLFDRVKLDCSNKRGLYKGDVGLDFTWIKDNGWDAFEEALWALGQAAYMDVAKKVIVDLETDVDSTMTDTVANWGNSHYKSLVKMDSLIRAASFTGPFAVIVNPAEVYDLMVLDYFIHQDYARVAVGAPASGALVGMLYGKTPIYSHRGATAASMTMVTVGKSSVLGIRQELQMEGYRSVKEGLEGAVLTLQYDYKNGSDAELTKPTKKSWAVATAA